MHRNQVSDSGTDIPDGFREEIDSIAAASHSEPFQVLGPHWIQRDSMPVLAIRAFHPGATSAHILWRQGGAPSPAIRLHPNGLFEAVLPSQTPGLIPGQPISPLAYRVEFTFADGARVQNI